MKSCCQLYCFLLLLAHSILQVDAMGPSQKMGFSFTQIEKSEFLAVFFLNNMLAGRATLFDITDETEEAKHAYLASFCIYSVCRKIGCGSKFLLYIMQELKELHFQQITGRVQPFFAGNITDESPDNIPLLIAFYKRHGFKQMDNTQSRKMVCNLAEVKIPIISYDEQGRMAMPDGKITSYKNYSRL